MDSHPPPRIPTKTTGARYRPAVTANGSTDRTNVARRNRPARRLPIVLGMQLHHRLGVGGEGEVWAATDADGDQYALKLIRPDVVAEPAAFVQRAEALARIDHPALVAVHDATMLSAGEWAGWGAMIMELIDGAPLDHAHLGAAAYVDLEPLAWALDRLHDGTWSDGHVLVHRDVKPANLIRAADDRIVLVDPSSLRSVGGDMTYVGTPLFVAPEVPSGRFGPPADVYSFAATLVALHSGARGDELADLLTASDALDVPEPVIRALSVDPRDRPTHCCDLVDTTHTIVVRSGTGAAVDRTAAPQTRRTWWRLGLLTAAALPVIAGLLWPAPAIALLGAALLAGLVAIDPSARDSTLPWLPLSCARWLARTFDTQDDGRDRIADTVHGALLLPLAPLAGLVVGLGPQMLAYGTVGQIAGVAMVCAVAVTWFAVVTFDDRRVLSAPKVVVAPVWIVGVFALAVGRVLAAIYDALAAPEDPLASGDDDPAPGEVTDDRTG
ncbi:hypothetical protein BH23ACT10_BH23ACT10_02700 [soil metagenome]